MRRHPPDWKRVRRVMRAHATFGAMLIVSAVLLFAGLGRDFLGEREGDTAVVAAGLLEPGAMRPADTGISSEPPLQYYAVAASFALFGETSFAARVPFALAGLGTIVLVYLLILQAGGRQRAAIAAVFLLMSSVQFLVFARQSRHYALDAFLTCLLIWQFARLDSWRSAVAFAVIAGLLGHTYPLGLIAVFALGGLALIQPASRVQRQAFVRALPIILVLMLPWSSSIWRGFAANILVPATWAQIYARALQFLIECGSVTPVAAALTMLALAYAHQRRERRRMGEAGRRPGWRVRIFSEGERRLVVTATAILILQAAVVIITLSRDTLWTVGIRYTPAVLPLGMMLTALSLEKSGASRRVWFATLMLLCFTTTGRITTWMFWDRPAATRDATAVAMGHQPQDLLSRFLRTSQAGFLTSLVTSNPGTIEYIATYLNAHARSHDLVVTNHDWDALSFHMRRAQAIDVGQLGPSALGQIRWIVWRPAWARQTGEDYEALLRSLSEAGTPITLVATLPETLWENRENVHFRRYPGGRYVFPFFEDLPPALIYRVGSPGMPGP